MATCNHKQCAICFRRQCQDWSRTLVKFGSVIACDLCVSKAVQWAYKTACMWGGSEIEQPCGREAGERLGG
jgi:hypothetical protein